MAVTPLMPILIGAVGTLVGNYFQNKAARIKNWNQHRDEELKQATEVFDEISGSIDTLAFFNTQALLAILYDEGEDPEERKEAAFSRYQDAFIGWNQSRTKYIAKVYRFFGNDFAREFKTIQKDFDLLNRLVMATYLERRDSKYFLEAEKGSTNDYREKYFNKVRKPLDRKMIEFNTGLINKTKELAAKKLNPDWRHG